MRLIIDIFPWAVMLLVLIKDISIAIWFDRLCKPYNSRLRWALCLIGVVVIALLMRSISVLLHHLSGPADPHSLVWSVIAFEVYGAVTVPVFCMAAGAGIAPSYKQYVPWVIGIWNFFFFFIAHISPPWTSQPASPLSGHVLLDSAWFAIIPFYFSLIISAGIRRYYKQS